MPHWSMPRPIVSVRVMVNVAVQEFGLSVPRCLSGSGLSGADLEDTAREVKGTEELDVLRTILAALGPGVPFALRAGLHYSAPTMGMWGLTVITSPNVRAALETGSRYTELSYSFNRLSYEIRPDRVRLLYGDEDNPEDVRAALVERDMGALIALQRGSLSTPLPIRDMYLKGPRPAHAGAFEPLFGVHPQWDAAENCIEIDPKCLDEVGSMADTFARDLCEEQCRALLERRQAETGLLGRVRSRLLRADGNFPAMPALAAELGMSTRTLRSQFARLGTTYRELTEQARQELAEQMLSTSQLTIGTIAERLGYADRSAFTAAFKRWKGMSPGEYRKHSATR